MQTFNNFEFSLIQSEQTCKLDLQHHPIYKKRLPFQATFEAYRLHFQCYFVSTVKRQFWTIFEGAAVLAGARHSVLRNADDWAHRVYFNHKRVFLFGMEQYGLLAASENIFAKPTCFQAGWPFWLYGKRLGLSQDARIWKCGENEGSPPRLIKKCRRECQMLPTFGGRVSVPGSVSELYLMGLMQHPKGIIMGIFLKRPFPQLYPKPNHLVSLLACPLTPQDFFFSCQRDVQASLGLPKHPAIVHLQAKQCSWPSWLQREDVNGAKQETLQIIEKIMFFNNISNIMDDGQDGVFDHGNIRPLYGRAFAIASEDANPISFQSFLFLMFVSCPSS